MKNFFVSLILFCVLTTTSLYSPNSKAAVIVGYAATNTAISVDANFLVRGGIIVLGTGLTYGFIRLGSLLIKSAEFNGWGVLKISGAILLWVLDESMEKETIADQLAVSFPQINDRSIVTELADEIIFLNKFSANDKIELSLEREKTLEILNRSDLSQKQMNDIADILK